MDLVLGSYAPLEESIFGTSDYDSAVTIMTVEIKKMYPSKVPLINKTNEQRQRELIPLIKPWLKSYIEVAMEIGRGVNLVNYKQDVTFNQMLRSKSGYNFFQNVELMESFVRGKKTSNFIKESVYNPKGYFEKYPDAKLDTTDKVLKAVGAGANKVLWAGVLGLVAYGVIMSSPKLLIGLKRAIKK